jgi:phosphoenolpyruvate carboxylase
MQAKWVDLIKKNKSLRQKNKGMPLVVMLEYLFCDLSVANSVVELSAELEASLQQVKDSKTYLKNIMYRETHARKVAGEELAIRTHECITAIEIWQATNVDHVRFMQSLQKLNKDSKKMRASLKELEEAALPIAKLLDPHVVGTQLQLFVDKLKEAPGCLATYVKHLAKSIPN